MIWTKQPIKKEIEALSSDKVNKTDIVNTLTDTSTNKPLSAAQGKALNDKYTTLNSKIATPPVEYTSYADVKSGIASKAASMASGSIASFDFHAYYSTAEELPGGYYTCILRKYDNNSYVADIISNAGADYKLTYAGNTWRMTSLSSNLTTVQLFKKLTVTTTTSAIGNVNITQLQASEVVVAVHPPVGAACAFIGRGNNGAYYVHVTDSSGNPITNTSVELDIYYVDP